MSSSDFAWTSRGVVSSMASDRIAGLVLVSAPKARPAGAVSICSGIQINGWNIADRRQRARTDAPQHHYRAGRIAETP